MSRGLKLGNLGPKFDDLCCGLKALSCGMEGPTPVNEDELFHFTIIFCFMRGSCHIQSVEIGVEYFIFVEF